MESNHYRAGQTLGHSAQDWCGVAREETHPMVGYGTIGDTCRVLTLGSGYPTGECLINTL